MAFPVGIKLIKCFTCFFLLRPPKPNVNELINSFIKLKGKISEKNYFTKIFKNELTLSSKPLALL